MHTLTQDEPATELTAAAKKKISSIAIFLGVSSLYCVSTVVTFCGTVVIHCGTARTQCYKM